MGGGVVVQTAQASAVLERAQTSFERSLASANSQNLTIRSGNYGLTTNNSCRPGASLLGRNIFHRFRQWAARRLARATSFSVHCPTYKEIRHAKRYGVQHDADLRART